MVISLKSKLEVLQREHNKMWKTCNGSCWSSCHLEEGSRDPGTQVPLGRLQCWKRAGCCSVALPQPKAPFFFFLLSSADIRCIRLDPEAFQVEAAFPSDISLRSELLGKKDLFQPWLSAENIPDCTHIRGLFRAAVLLWSKSAKPAFFQGTDLIHSVTGAHGLHLWGAADLEAREMLQNWYCPTEDGQKQGPSTNSVFCVNTKVSLKSCLPVPCREEHSTVALKHFSGESGGCCINMCMQSVHHRTDGWMTLFMFSCLVSVYLDCFTDDLVL